MLLKLNLQRFVSGPASFAIVTSDGTQVCYISSDGDSTLSFSGKALTITAKGDFLMSVKTTNSTYVDSYTTDFAKVLTITMKQEIASLSATTATGMENITIAFATTPTYKFKHWKKSNVVVNRTVVGEKYYYFKPYTILGLYTITTTLTNCTGASANATKIQENGGLTLTFTANSGYELPTGVSVTNVTSYNWNKSTGVLAISKPTGDVTIEIVAVSALPQLSTPTNLSISDSTLSWDEVENATSYDIYVDDVVVGTYVVEQALIASVTGLGSSSPSSVTFDVPSDFKFTDGEFTDSDGNVFVKIPKMYRKINATSDGQITSFSISNKKVDDSYQVYPVFLKEDGTTEMDYVGIGKYMNKSSTKVNSVASGRVTGMTLGSARSNIKENYSYGKYQLYDWMFHKLWQDLIICKMQTINTNSGSGIQQDQLGIYWGSSYQWVDGFGHVSEYVYLCDKPSKYVDSPTASSDGYFTTSYRIATTSLQEIQKLGYDELHPFVNLPSAVISNSSYNTYYCDEYWYSSGNYPFLCYVGDTHASYGAFFLSGYSDWADTRGVRLCYRPIGE